MENYEQEALYIIEVLQDGLDYSKIGAAMSAFMQWVEDFWEAKDWDRCWDCCDRLEKLADDPDMQKVSDVDTKYVRGIAQMYRGAILLSKDVEDVENSQNRLETANGFFRGGQALFQEVGALHCESVAWLAQGIACQKQYESRAYPKEHHCAQTLKALQRSLTLFRDLGDGLQVDVRGRLAQVRKQLKDDLDVKKHPARPEEPSNPKPSRWFTLQFLPIVSERIAAGKPRLATDDVTGYIATDVFRVGDQDLILQMLKGSELRFQPEYCYFATHVSGDSMDQADIAPNDYVILVKPLFSELSPQHRDIVAAVIAGVDEKATLKRFLRKDNRISLKPESSNSDHQAHKFSLHEFNKRVRIAGVAVAVLKPKPS